MTTIGPDVASRPRTRRRVPWLLTVALVATATVFAGAPAVAAPPAGATTRVAEPVQGSLSWKPCSDPRYDRWKKTDDNSLDGFQCSTFVRPLDRSRPQGKQVTLAVVRMPATGPAVRAHGHPVPQPGRTRPVGRRPLRDRLPAPRVRARELRLRHLRPARDRRVHSGARRSGLQHPQAHPACDRGRRLEIGPGRAPAAGGARQRAAASPRTASSSSTVAPATACTTWTRCAPRSATRRSPTGGSRTARCSVRPTRRSSPIGSGRWSSTATWTRRSRWRASASAPPRPTTRSASSSRRPGCRRSSIR